MMIWRNPLRHRKIPAVTCALLFIPTAIAQQPAPSLPVPASTQPGHDAAARCFDELLAVNPEAVVTVTFSLAPGHSLGELKGSFSGFKGRLTALHHHDGTRTGGFSLEPGESLDSAFAAYRRDHLLFAQRRAQVEKQLLTNERDPQLKAALERSVVGAQAAAEQVRADGPVIIGFVLEASARAIQQFRDSTRTARVIEVSQPPILLCTSSRDKP